MIKRVLVVGATGTLGAPVARALLDHGYAVRALVRSTARAAANPLLDGAEWVEGDVLDAKSVRVAMQDCQALYSSLSSDSFDLKQSVEYRGNRVLCAAAAEAGLAWVGYISGAGDLAAFGEHRPLVIKANCEALFRHCGVPYTVFKPTHFFESLPLFVRDGRIAIPGRQVQRYHYLAAADYAQVVVAAMAESGCHRQSLTLLGPEALSMAEALAIYRDAVMPGQRIGYLPLWLARTLGRLPPLADMGRMAELFTTFDAGIPEGEASLLPAHFPAISTRCKQWSEAQALSST